MSATKKQRLSYSDGLGEHTPAWDQVALRKIPNHVRVFRWLMKMG